MLSKRILAILLIIFGAILLFVAYQSSLGLGDQVTEAVTGRFTDSTEWLIVLGVVSSVVGIVILLLGESSIG